MPLPPRLIIPARSPDPKPKPAGTVLQKGQSLLESPGGPSAPARSKIIGERIVSLTNGALAYSVALEIDAPDAESSLAAEQLTVSAADLPTMDLPGILDRLLHSGVWADRRGVPDLIGQLNRACKRPIDTIICNCIDHEPPLRPNTVFASHFGHIIFSAIGVLKKAMNAKTALFVLDQAVPPSLHEALSHFAKESGVQIALLPVRYPQADPTLLLYSLLARPLKPGFLPVEHGALVLDAAAALAVGNSLLFDQPMLHVPVAVRDRLRNESQYVLAAVGTPVRDLLDWLEINPDRSAVFCGDLLAQNLATADTVVGASELKIHTLPPSSDSPSTPCVRCGWCVDQCPMAVHPARLLEASQQEDKHMALSAGLEYCIECGICSYICPSQLPLASSIRKLKVM
ncbi:MAG TPA: 4Fe-4S dicluster domain-containing protein [Tepidisphaeraceae bacterium]|jgi:electron transport complex protein RnfC|nr:4Fe-4S dicluster domain-containing protein [Tepidisphaeraceae bacterium]